MVFLLLSGSRVQFFHSVSERAVFKIAARRIIRQSIPLTPQCDKSGKERLVYGLDYFHLVTGDTLGDRLKIKC